MIDFRKIKAIGFDLDDTLYRTTPLIKKVVRSQIYNEISNHLIISPAEAERLFELHYQQIQSGGKVLQLLGIPQGREILRQCLLKANVSRFLQRDERLLKLLSRTSKDYFLFLITESLQEDALRKLNALGISKDSFQMMIFWDSNPLRKDNGSIFQYLASENKLLPAEIVFCGDRLQDDILPAEKIGYNTILVGSNDTKATMCISSIYDLEENIYGTR